MPVYSSPEFNSPEVAAAAAVVAVAMAVVVSEASEAVGSDRFR
jgi:hypothetical protein